MKIRNGFVSNSSSSSFILNLQMESVVIVFKTPLIQDGMFLVRTPSEQQELIELFGNANVLKFKVGLRFMYRFYVNFSDSNFNAVMVATFLRDLQSRADITMSILSTNIGTKMFDENDVDGYLNRMRIRRELLYPQNKD